MKPGATIADRYELQEPIGQGGMAEVWRALDHRLLRPVAIKFLARRFSEDPESLVRFFAEAQSVARIQHPNVVTVLDFGELDGHPYLVMEYIPGGPLAGMIGTPMMPERALELVGAASAGAGAAHEIGIVHRDIKPGNILLDEDGKPKLADFGIASSHMVDRLTATGVAVGSPHYISPEQAAGASATSHSDVYSLGVVLYEMLTGTKPFQGKSMAAVVIAHVEQLPEPPGRRIAGLDPRIDALVMRCLAKDPEDRYEDGYHLQEAILEMADPGSTRAMGRISDRWIGGPGGDEAPPKRGRLLALALAVVVLGGLLALNFTGDNPAPASKPTRSTTNRPSSPRTSPAGGDRGEAPAPESSENAPAEEPTPAQSPSPTESPTPPAPSPSSESPSPSPSPTESPLEEVAPGPTPSEETDSAPSFR